MSLLFAPRWGMYVVFFIWRSGGERSAVDSVPCRAVLCCDGGADEVLREMGDERRWILYSRCVSGVKEVEEPRGSVVWG